MIPYLPNLRGKELALKAVEVIKEHRDWNEDKVVWEQMTFGEEAINFDYMKEPPKDIECGTACCFAGFVVIIADGLEEYLEQLRGGSMSIPIRASDLLNFFDHPLYNSFETGSPEEIYNGGNKLEEIEEKIEEIYS